MAGPFRFDGARVIKIDGADVMTPLVKRARRAGDDAQAAMAASGASAARAELARDGAIAAARLYATVGAGLAASSAGEFFTVPGDGTNTYAILYRKVDGAAVEQARYASKAAYEGTGGADLIGYLGRSVRSKLDESRSVRDAQFAGGAKGDGVADDTASIQAAIDYVESVGGGRVLVPEGRYKTTAAIILRGKASLIGNGPASVIKATGCNGLLIEKSDEIAPRQVANIRLYATGGEVFTGILSDVAFPDRVQGLTFENVFVDFFGTGIAGRGFWHTAFRNVVLNHCHRGFYFYDRSVVINMDDCKATHGGLVGGDGPSIGFQVGDDNPSFRPEEMWLRRCFFFGFDKGVVWRNALYGGAAECGIDACGQTGLEITTADGGTTFKAGWIDIIGTTGNLRGIHFVPLGYQPPPINIDVRGIRVNVPPTTTPDAEAVGLLIEANQANATISTCSFPNPNSRSMRIEGQPSARVKRVRIENNECARDGQFFNMDGSWIDKNTFASGMAISGNVNMSYGANKGLHTTESIVEFIMPAGQTQFARTWLSMNAADLPFGAEQIACWPSVNGMLTQGGVSTSATRTSVSVKVDTALGADSPIRLLTRIN